MLTPVPTINPQLLQQVTRVEEGENIFLKLLTKVSSIAGHSSMAEEIKTHGGRQQQTVGLQTSKCLE